MLVLSMNSKRQRRPNVRLGEVGDVPAAFACDFSYKSSGKLGLRSFGNDVLNSNATEQSHILGFPMQAHPDLLDTGPGVCPKFSDDLQQNRENKDPNSSKTAFELVSSDQIDRSKLKLNFGSITRKGRIMKRRGRNAKGANNIFIGSVWSSQFSPQFSNEVRRDSTIKDFVKFTSDECDVDYATSRDACEFDMDKPVCYMRQQRNCNEFWQENACNEGNDAYFVSDHSWDAMKSASIDVNTVTRWLEDQGFGKYAGMFELHEVDEETLPLLTLEDLKEMGLFAVGPRRKLYTAIQQLRKEGVSA